MFPSKLGMNQEVMAAPLQPDIDEIATLDDEQGPQAVLATLPIEEKYIQGILFYMSLKPENDVTLRRRRCEAGNAESAHLLVQADRGRASIASSTPTSACRKWTLRRLRPCLPRPRSSFAVAKNWRSMTNPRSSGPAT